MHIFWVKSMTHGFTSIPKTQDCVKRTPSCAAFVPEGFRLQICSRTSWAIHLGNFVDPDAMLSIETEKVFPAKKYHSCCRQAKWFRWYLWRLELMAGWGVGPRVWLNLVADHGTCFKRISIFIDDFHMNDGGSSIAMFECQRLFQVERPQNQLEWSFSEMLVERCGDSVLKWMGS